MADANKIQAGSYKGFPIRIVTAGTTGGRKNAIHEFPNRDTQTVEDLGLKPRSYTLSIVVSDFGKFIQDQQPKQNYFEYKESLLAVIESNGAGVLIHPMYGRIDNVKATTYSLSENFTEFGRSLLNVSFEVDSDTGIPKSASNSISQIAQNNLSVVTLVGTDIAENFLVSSIFTGNFSAAVDKVNQIIDGVKDATDFIGASSNEINNFNSTLGQLSDNVNSLVSDPIALSDSITSTFSLINGLFASVESTAEAFTRLFSFGDSDIDLNGNTAGLAQRRGNNATLNASVNAQALGYAYENYSQATFETIDQIEAAEDALDQQYAIVLTSGADQDVKDQITSLRVQVQDFFNDQKLNASQVISVYTNTTSARLLSFSYYGTPDNGSDIIALNNTPDVSFISGNIDILTS